MKKNQFFLSLFAGLFIALSSQYAVAENVELLNVSYNSTRELYEEINKEFALYIKNLSGPKITIKQSYGASGKQTQAVIDGLQADIVLLASSDDIDQISQKTGKIPSNWQKLLPNNSVPYTSTVVFIVRKGNPKKIKDWDDLILNDIKIVTPNPKTSGGGRWNYLAAFAYANKFFSGNKERSEDFMSRILHNVVSLDDSSSEAVTSFSNRNVGDVLITWENEAFLLAKKSRGNFEIVIPSLSILAEPAVTVVSGNTDLHQRTEIASAYVDFLYSKKGQEIIAKHYFRPINEEIASKFSTQFTTIEMVTIDKNFGGWEQVDREHFQTGGSFDRIYETDNSSQKNRPLSLRDTATQHELRPTHSGNPSRMSRGHTGNNIEQTNKTTRKKTR